MAKTAKHSVTIRYGAAYDDVRIRTGNGDMHFDRAELGKRKREGDTDAGELLYQVRKGVVDAFVALGKDRSKRANRRHRNHIHNHRKAA